jgi:hypothetical protein
MRAIRGDNIRRQIRAKEDPAIVRSVEVSSGHLFQRLEAFDDVEVLGSGQVTDKGQMETKGRPSMHHAETDRLKELIFKSLDGEMGGFQEGEPDATRQFSPSETNEIQLLGLSRDAEVFKNHALLEQ